MFSARSGWPGGWDCRAVSFVGPQDETASSAADLYVHSTFYDT
jgi:hypothetical protein